MQLNPIARVRNALEQIEKLHGADQLTPERLRGLLVRAERDLTEAAAEIEPTEQFDITLQGLQALHVNGKPTRFRGGLCIIDGDRA